MRNIWLFLAAVTLILFGVAGLMILSGMRQYGTVEKAKSDTSQAGEMDTGAGEEDRQYSSLGESIYYEGIGSEGRKVPYTAGPHWMRTMGERGCVNCHGIDGKGGFSLMMTSMVAPSITYDSLISEMHHHDGQAEVHEGRYTDEAIKRVIAQGIDPSGKELDKMMPRWKMTDAELNELLDYLKEL